MLHQSMGTAARHPGRADLLLVVSAVSFGALPVFGRFAYAQGMNVPSLLAARFLLAGAIRVTIAAARRAKTPGRGTLVMLVLLGAVGYAAQSAAYFNSIRYVPAAVTSILLYTYPVVVTALSRPIYGVPLTRRRLVALAIALAGTFLVANPSGGLRWEGVALGLLSAVFYSAYILTGKRVLEAVDPWFATAVIALSAGAAYLVFGAASGSLAPPPTLGAWLAVFGLAVISTVVGAGAFLAGLRLTDPGRASLISTLEPVSTAILAAVVFAELLGSVQLAGGALVLVSVLVIAAAPEVSAAAGNPPVETARLA
jgi:drug/metabolite transporter (DMT)-like permease